MGGYLLLLRQKTFLIVEAILAMAGAGYSAYPLDAANPKYFPVFLACSTLGFITLRYHLYVVKYHNLLNKQGQAITALKEESFKYLETLTDRVVTKETPVRIYKIREKRFHKHNNGEKVLVAEPVLVEGLPFSEANKKTSFVVNGERPEGLVGKCYQRETPLCDNKMQIRSERKYNLSQEQKHNTQNVKFAIATPVYPLANISMPRNNRVIYIVTIGCHGTLELTRQQKLECSNAFRDCITTVYEKLEGFTLG